MKFSPYQVFVFLWSFVLFSCKNHCPLPTCKIRTEHHHAINFKNTKSHQKELLKQRKEEQKKEQQAALAKQDSITNTQAENERLKNLNSENDQKLTDDTALEKKKVKRKNKSEASLDSKDPKTSATEENNDNKELAANDKGSEKSAKQEIKEAEKIEKQLEKEAKEAERKEKEANKEADIMYRSKVTPWWKKNKNPKIGEDYETPEREVKENIQDYDW